MQMFALWTKWIKKQTKDEIHIPKAESVAKVPRNSDGAISAKYMPSTAVVVPDAKPTINRANSITSTDIITREKYSKNPPIENNDAQQNMAPFLKKKINIFDCKKIATHEVHIQSYHLPNLSANLAAVSEPAHPPTRKIEIIVDHTRFNWSWFNWKLYLFKIDSMHQTFMNSYGEFIEPML